jgi:hypothetical protein
MAGTGWNLNTKYKGHKYRMYLVGLCLLATDAMLPRLLVEPTNAAFV